MKTDREIRIKKIQLLKEKVRRHKQNRSKRVYESFYVWQREFLQKTSEYHESCLCAANQIGKTRTGTCIDAIHATGDYPDDWNGHKFERAPIIWCLGFSMEKTRDLIQKKLFGEYSSGTGFEGGLVPKDRIVSWESASGTVNAMRTVRVKHRGGGLSIVQFWSYSQGQHAIMGDVVDWVHVDEEPRDQTIRPQLLTRTINGDQGRGGRIMYTFTPENGRTELVIKFMDDPSPTQYFMQKGWSDAPHMTEEKRARLLEQYPDHQKKMRSEGEPMLGHGRIYDVSDEFVMCEPFPIPDHWAVIGGLDFGWDHPQAVSKLAWDMDSDIIYVVNSWKMSKVSASDAWAATRAWIAGVPVSWPHDGLQNEKGRDDATPLKNHYTAAGFNMLGQNASWPEGGNSVENGIYQIINRARNGTLKIFRGQPELMDEWRQYHRDEKGKIVKVRDDILDTIRYAYMMLRASKRVGDIGKKAEVIMPPPIKQLGRR